MITEEIIKLCVSKFFGSSNNAPEFDLNKVKEIVEYLHSEGHIVSNAALEETRGNEYLRERVLQQALNQGLISDKATTQAEEYYNYIKNGIKQQ